MSMRVSGAGELRTFLAFSHYKTAISFYIPLVGNSETLSQKHMFFRSQITPAGSFLLLLYGAIYKR